MLNAKQETLEILAVHSQLVKRLEAITMVLKLSLSQRHDGVDAPDLVVQGYVVINKP